VQQRLPSLLDPPIAFAHRGARAHAPDNTLESFELALKLGATGLESDVWLTADGVPVLDHDGVVRQGMRKRPISSCRRDQLPAHIPALGDLFDAVGTGFALSLDLKDPASAGPTVEVIAGADVTMLDRVWLCESQLDRVIELRRHFDAQRRPVRLLQTTRLSRITGTPEQRAAALSASGVDGINMPRTDWNGGLVTLFHRFDLVAFGWNMQLGHEIAEGVRMGLDAVYSDHVDTMTDVFRAEVG
jgi:glycerophosphoryl diester phosphodiesterase